MLMWQMLSRLGLPNAVQDPGGCSKEPLFIYCLDPCQSLSGLPVLSWTKGSREPPPELFSHSYGAHGRDVAGTWWPEWQGWDWLLYCHYSCSSCHRLQSCIPSKGPESPTSPVRWRSSLDLPEYIPFLVQNRACFSMILVP